ncbi:unnamed protein product [Mycena citricolor]|uniref:AAA+ ATPase domain-containing protein n=1 Tax=Mycena citricolor TaxID=2018698 RepID=A0AAD2Q5T2_9AGAR|nr:unnamed protein product [Mycena citricolor]
MATSIFGTSSIGVDSPTTNEEPNTTSAMFSFTLKPDLLGTSGLGNAVQTTSAGALFVANGLLSGGGIGPTASASSSSHKRPVSPPSWLDEPEPAQPGPTASIFASSSYPSGSDIQTHSFDGKTVVFKKKKTKASTEARDRVTRATKTFTERMGNLLDVPIHRMLETLSLEKAQALQASDLAQPSGPLNEDAEPEHTLWVDRYRPRQFSDLTGNERVAREVMTWVKQWDWCVFGKGKGKKRARPDDEERFDIADEYRRPKEKLLLLSGPPGLGKTSLAHVIARQAGYEVMEINASDARSGSIVDDRIRPALESGSAVGSTKPVLLVIDEIDGATGSGDNSSTFIAKLIQLTQGKPTKKGRNGKGRDPNAKRPILRPIICICNDQNASALAKLRTQALQVRFVRPADIHTVKRLREVCEIEGLRADSRALSTLVGVAKGDLRGCLNTLQFIKSRNLEVSEIVIRKATVGMKEADSSLITVVNNLFIPLTRKRVKELGLTEAEENKYVGRLAREVEACGRESSVAVGCFAHYATVHQHDANFSRQEKANEWLVTFDLLSTSMYSDGDFALHPYISYSLVPFFPLFKDRMGQRVERSQVDWESQVQARANEEIYKSLARCLRTASTRHGGDFRHFVHSPILQLEFSPYINRIISPPLRPVNAQVIKPEERAVLSRLVDVMSTLELQFFQERAEDGQLSYRLDPPIDVFVTYDGKRAADMPVSRYAVRHLVAGEIEAQLIAKRVDIVERERQGKKRFLNADSSAPKAPEDKAPSNKRARTDGPVIDIADKPPTDFFGRPITVQSASSAKSAARKNVAKEFRVSYKFKEGNSSAVRKPVKISAFM